MALFSGNRKVRSRRPKSTQELKQEAIPQQRSQRHLAKQADDLNHRIHRLECFITAAPRLERQKRLDNVNMVPPMELSSPAPRRGRMPIAKQRARRSEHVRLFTEAMVVIGSIAAVVGWLNQWFHFWS